MQQSLKFNTLLWKIVLWSLFHATFGKVLLPPVKFLRDFAMENSLLGHVIYLPLSENRHKIIPYRKQAR